jgi:hypothetical protein
MSEESIFVDAAKVDEVLATGQTIPGVGIELSYADKWEQAEAALDAQENEKWEQAQAALSDQFDAEWAEAAGQDKFQRQLTDEDKWADVNPADMQNQEPDGEEFVRAKNGRVIAKKVVAANKDDEITTVDELTSALCDMRQRTA